MAALPDVPEPVTRRAFPRGVASRGVAVVVFALLAWCGVDLLVRGAAGLGVPMLIAGVAGAAGALVIAGSVLRWRDDVDPPVARAGVQRAARRGMAVAAVVVVLAGVVLAPAGWERGFVITVGVLTGGLLAVFALLAGERAARRASA